jgi:hypothetical protein
LNREEVQPRPIEFKQEVAALPIRAAGEASQKDEVEGGQSGDQTVETVGLTPSRKRKAKAGFDNRKARARNMKDYENKLSK